MSGNKCSRTGCIQVEIIYRTNRTGPFYSALFLRQKWKTASSDHSTEHKK